MVESIRTQKITGCWQIEDLVNFPKKKKMNVKDELVLLSS